MREIEPDEEAEFEDLEPRVEERNGMVGKVSSRVAGWLYSDGEPAAPRPNVEYRETGRRSGQRDGRNEPDEDINPSNNGFANPFARFSAKADSTTTSAPFSPHAAVAKARLTATNAMAAAAKMDRLVREFPESFATQPADPFAPSAVVPRNPNAPDPASSPNPVKPIPEAKLRRFLIREAQQDRPDSHLNPALPPKTPVASRQFLSNNVPTMLAGKSASARARVGQKVRLQHALQDAERYKQPTEQLWNEYFSVGVKGATGWQALVEERIEQARREGQFENLPGAGERIKYLEDDPAARNPFLDNVECGLLTRRSVCYVLVR